MFFLFGFGGVVGGGEFFSPVVPLIVDLCWLEVDFLFVFWLVGVVGGGETVLGIVFVASA